MTSEQMQLRDIRKIVGCTPEYAMALMPEVAPLLAQLAAYEESSAPKRMAFAVRFLIRLAGRGIIWDARGGRATASPVDALVDAERLILESENACIFLALTEIVARDLMAQADRLTREMEQPHVTIG